MMGGYRINRDATGRIADRVDVNEALAEVAARILEDSDKNIVEMGAIDTGKMILSGMVEQEGRLTRVSYYAHNPVDDFAYDIVVHDGSGRGRNAVPRPFLLEAATRTRDVP